MSSAKLFITIVIVNNPEDTDNGGNKKELTGDAIKKLRDYWLITQIGFVYWFYHK